MQRCARRACRSETPSATPGAAVRSRPSARRRPAGPCPQSVASGSPSVGWRVCARGAQRPFALGTRVWSMDAPPVPLRGWPCRPSRAALPALSEALDRIGHEELVTVQAGLAQRLVQQVARRADKGRALQVLLRAGLLAHQHDARVRGPLAGHALGGVALQRATTALVQLSAADGGLLALGHDVGGAAAAGFMLDIRTQRAQRAAAHACRPRPCSRPGSTRA